MQTIDTPPTLPKRDPAAHKGDFGRVLLVGGSRSMLGAPALAANAALRGGAGLGTLAVPESIHLPAATLCPCATSLPLPDSGGQIGPGTIATVTRAARTIDALAVGPGLAVGPEQQLLIEALLNQPRPLVLDADGLNTLVKIVDWPARRQCPLILTPHPGEFARLTGRAVGDIQADRTAALLEAHRTWQASAITDAPLVVLLKGAGSAVTDGGRIYINTTGNAGMATGGTGDVLTGLTAALTCQLADPFDATCLAVWTHGRAGDLAAQATSQPSLIATDLLEYLPRALAEAIA